MTGVHLNNEQVTQLTEAMKTLFSIQPPSKLGAGWERVEQIMTEKTCLACHTYQNEGAPQGGIGGPLENASGKEESLLADWLQNPTADNALKLKISETPIGAMATFALPQEDAQEVAKWLKTLANK